MTASAGSFAVATGIGSWPGADPRTVAAIVVGELHDLPYLPELPQRGVGADLIGRAGGLLVDIAIDTVPRGYRIAARPGSVTRRAASLLGEDLDALEEAWEKAGGGAAVKVQAPGPITLAAQLELANGHRAITDPGAMRDITASLAEGMARHRAEVARRLATTVLVQFDEPLLPAALAGRLTGVTAMSAVHAVDEARAISLLDDCVAAVDGAALLHCCADDIPWKILQRSAFPAISVDARTLADEALDALGEFIDSGRSVVLGLVPALAPAPASSLSPAAAPSFGQIAEAAAAITDRLGFPRAVLHERVGISPSCGLAGATESWARAATTLSQRAVAATADLSG